VRVDVQRKEGRWRLTAAERGGGESVFDSPFEFCTTCGDYVLLDQTNAECAREHRCRDIARCPLRRYFTGVQFEEGRGADAARGAARPPKS
jgi:hypothetical protein